MSISQQDLALIAENERLRKENETMRAIGSTDGFYEFYFKQIKHFKTRREAFDYVNELYYKFFTTYKYSDYESFRVSVNYYNKKTKR